MGVDLHAETVSRVISRLREEREKRGLSQETLARMAGLSRTGIRHVESGHFKPTLYTLLKIADAQNLNLPRLLAQAQKSAGAKK